MKADLSRNTFNPLKHFTRVLMQQGRVQLDADWNEQAGILLRYLQALAADLIGPHGGPEADCGFGIAPVGSSTKERDFLIGLGHYYVDGFLCEADSTPVAIFPATGSAANVVRTDAWTLDGAPLDTYPYVEVFDEKFSQVFDVTADPKQRTLALTGTPALNLKNLKNPKLRRVITYLHQPDYPLPEPLKAGTYRVYLDVWERHITYVEDDGIREVALGGPDTATRAKLVWQVKVVPGSLSSDSKDPCGDFKPADANFLSALLGRNRGRLKAQAKLLSVSTDPCILPPDAQYRGPENQLYRVEIHRGGPVWDQKSKESGATFKFSRENGSVVFALARPITSSGGATTAVLETLGRDDRFGLSEGDWVEVQDDRSILANEAGNLLQVQVIDRTAMTVTLNGTPGISVGGDLALHPLLRRWDHKEGDPAEGGLQLSTDGAALIIEDSDGLWLSLEDGVQIQFQKPDSSEPANYYRTGDYWLIPARTATGDVEWPKEKDPQGDTVRIALPPAGVTHHYAPLAVITLDGKDKVTDCRKKFENLVKLTPAKP